MQQIITGYEQIGLRLYGEFITPDEEQKLLATIDGIARKKRKNTKGRASIQRYGSNIPYNSYMQARYVPDYLAAYSERLVELKLLDEMPDTVSINEYEIGQTIEPHIDSPTAGYIISILSLESPAVMRFTLDKQQFDVELPVRCMVQLRDDIREKWKHAILPVPGHRFSVVFRRGRML